MKQAPEENKIVLTDLKAKDTYTYICIIGIITVFLNHNYTQTSVLLVLLLNNDRGELYELVS